MPAIEQPTELQRVFWNEWNASTREISLSKVSLEQADIIVSWLEGLGRKDLKIIEIGCGAGWLCSRLTRFGQVTGTDLSDEVLARAAARTPAARFVAGDFMALDFNTANYDVAISLEVLSHVADQEAFLGKISRLLKPGGHVMLATQNKPALQRNTIPAPKPGQLRRWVDRHELRQLLTKDFQVRDLFSITPIFNRGLLRLVNSYKLEKLLTMIRLGNVVTRVKKVQQDAWLGWTLMALARKPD